MHCPNRNERYLITSSITYMSSETVVCVILTVKQSSFSTLPSHVVEGQLIGYPDNVGCFAESMQISNLPCDQTLFDTKPCSGLQVPCNDVGCVAAAIHEIWATASRNLE
jgi:hypothetical protein